MIFELILVCGGIAFFVILTTVQQENHSRVKTDFIQWISKSAVLSGAIITVLKMIVLVGQLETMLNLVNIADETLEFFKFFIMFLVRLRPLLLGLLIKLLIHPFTKTSKKGHEQVEQKEANVEGFSGSKLDLRFNTNLKNGGVKALSEASLDPTYFSKLSRREIEVARLAAKGYTNAQISEELFISVETVKRHMATIFEKLGIESRKDLML